MLKIKDNVDLKELEKFGFEFISSKGHPFNCFDLYYKETEEKIHIEIFIDSRYVVIYKYDLYEDESTILKDNIEQYVVDLTKADMVEKVSDE